MKKRGLGLLPDNDEYIDLTDEELRLLDEGHKKTIGKTLREARIAKGYSIRELSEIVGISAAQLSRVENGNSRPSRDLLRKISAFLGIEYGELVRLTGFSALKADRRLFNKQGEEIDPEKIIKSIYAVDSDLLELLSDLNAYCEGSDCEFLHVILETMKDLHEVRKEGEMPDAERFRVNAYESMKKCIVDTFRRAKEQL